MIVGISLASWNFQFSATSISGSFSQRHSRGVWHSNHTFPWLVTFLVELPLLLMALLDLLFLLDTPLYKNFFNRSCRNLSFDKSLVLRTRGLYKISGRLLDVLEVLMDRLRLSPFHSQFALVDVRILLIIIVIVNESSFIFLVDTGSTLLLILFELI